MLSNTQREKLKRDLAPKQSTHHVTVSNMAKDYASGSLLRSGQRTNEYSTSLIKNLGILRQMNVEGVDSHPHLRRITNSDSIRLAAASILDAHPKETAIGQYHSSRSNHIADILSKRGSSASRDENRPGIFIAKNVIITPSINDIRSQKARRSSSIQQILNGASPTEKKLFNPLLQKRKSTDSKTIQIEEPTQTRRFTSASQPHRKYSSYTRNTTERPTSILDNKSALLAEILPVDKLNQLIVYFENTAVIKPSPKYSQLTQLYQETKAASRAHSTKGWISYLQQKVCFKSLQPCSHLDISQPSVSLANQESHGIVYKSIKTDINKLITTELQVCQPEANHFC